LNKNIKKRGNLMNVKDILADAKEYAKSHKCNYSDYEYYKNKLHNIGEYGYEPELARILRV
jgi:hypothetical protein